MQAEPQVGGVLLGDAEAGSATPGALMPLCCPSGRR
jgi:hypothetical protein